MGLKWRITIIFFAGIFMGVCVFNVYTYPGAIWYLELVLVLPLPAVLGQ